MKQFVFDWHDVGILGRTDKATFQIILESTGRILINVTQNHMLDKSYVGLIAPDGTKTPWVKTWPMNSVALAFVPDGCVECEDVPEVPEPEPPPVVVPEPETEPPCTDCGDYVVTVPCGTKRVIINLC